MELVERTESLNVLEELLAHAVLGKGGVAMLSGPVASGKSALLHALAERSIDLGVLSITATGSRMEQDIPMGVLSQLLQDAPLVSEERDRALGLLTEGSRSAMSSGFQAGALQQVDAQIVHALCTVLLELADRYPLLITVDDAQHADRASLLCLAYLARRVRATRMVMVFSHPDQQRQSENFFQTELLRQPQCRHIRLEPLSRGGVMSLISERLGTTTNERFIDEWYQLSGGNPLLAAALADDYRDHLRTGASPPNEVVVSDRYGQAVLSSLHRGEPETLRVARGLAILGEPDGLASLLGTPQSHVTREMQALTTTGLVRFGVFGHEVARSAVLRDMDVQERMDLHRRAAELAYDAGAPAVVVADHLLQASKSSAPWLITVLEEAARSALRSGYVEDAIAYLRMAWRECTDETYRAKIMTMLVRAEWRINPVAPAGHLNELTDAMHRGSLRGSDAIVLSRALLWHGRFDDAREVLEQLNESEAIDDAETLSELVIAQLWLRTTHPPFQQHLRHPVKEHGLAAVASVAASRRLESALALAEVLSRGPREEDMGSIERILEGSRLDEMSMDTVENALLALTYAGQCERATPWCDLFFVEASSRHSPSRQARLAAIRAEIAIRKGDMQGADHYGRIALDIIPFSGWGVAVGGPLSSLILAATATGNYHAVADHLEQPIPEAMFETRYGLHYLYARGRYSMAIDYPALALRDFQRCGELMTAWDLDVPGLVPWRADAAEACLRMGRTDEARQLVEAQLARCDQQTPRAKGIAMRVLAATSELRSRPALLRQAAEFLQRSGDKYELGRALYDLVEAHQGLGEQRRAGLIAAQAQAVTKECRAEPLTSALSRGEDVDAIALPLANEVTAALSEAERRVAVLAAIGYTNREIANRLYISISTVEQHLTRTYRKLEIHGRADLLPRLGFDGQGVPESVREA
ncbi:AAA family ATPase [Nonomuraea sp. B12E4]|uniref:helix-turn-helix transcriptional regulator n=1 Tax=Nonomuraea sp. B12E4 TaxID=3153564 RepID=UPI00325DF876